MITMIGLHWQESNFKVFFPEDYRTLFTPERERDPALRGFLSLPVTCPNLRKTLWIDGIQFTVGFFLQEREVVFCTPRLSRELIEKCDDERVLKVRDIDCKQMPSTIQLQMMMNPLLPDLFDEKKLGDVYKRTEALFHEIVQQVGRVHPSLLELITDFALSLFARYPRLRNKLLKFISLLPTLARPDEVDELKKLLFEAMKRMLGGKVNAEGEPPLPWWMRVAIWKSQFLLKLIPASTLARLLHFKMNIFGKRFVAGRDIESAKVALTHLERTGREATLDQLGELVFTEKEADDYTEQACKMIRAYSTRFPGRQLNRAGLPKNEISIKVSAMGPYLRAYAFDHAYQKIAPRLKKILLCARQHGAFVNVDAEHYRYRDVVFNIYRKILLETKELKEFKDVGIVVQAYLKDAPFHFMDILSLARERGLRMPIRLVKGAYWDSESREAWLNADNAPQFLNKEESDLCFRQLVYLTLQNGQFLQLRVASHNFAEHAFAEALHALHFPSSPRVEHQCLHMTCEPLSLSMARMGWAQRDYVPVGNLLVGMGYLVRRILENSSQVGFLTLLRDQKALKHLQHPHHLHEQNIREQKLKRDFGEEVVSNEFFHHTPLPLYREELWKTIQQDEELIDHPVGIAVDDDREVSSLRFRDLIILNRMGLAKLVSRSYGMLIPDALQEINGLLDDLLHFSLREKKKKETRGPILIITDVSSSVRLPWREVIFHLLNHHPVLVMNLEKSTWPCWQWLHSLVLRIGHGHFDDKMMTLLPLGGAGQEEVHKLVQSRTCDKIIDLSTRKTGLINAFVVSANADVSDLLAEAIPSFLLKGGPSSDSLSLILIHRGKSEIFRKRFVAALQNIVIGDPIQLSSLLPTMTEEKRKSFLAHVRDWKTKGLEDMEILLDMSEEGHHGEPTPGPLIVHLNNWALLDKNPGILQRMWGPFLIIVTYDDLADLKPWFIHMQAYFKRLSFFAESERDREGFKIMMKEKKILFNQGIHEVF